LLIETTTASKNAANIQSSYQRSNKNSDSALAHHHQQQKQQQQLSTQEQGTGYMEGSKKNKSMVAVLKQLHRQIYYGCQQDNPSILEDGVNVKWLLL
jgi:hypothetical protein